MVYGIWRPQRGYRPLYRLWTIRKSTSYQRLDLPSSSFNSHDLRDTIVCSSGERRHTGLHANFDSFERTERNVGKEFGRSRSRQVEPGFVLVRILSAGQIGIELLEPLISAIFEGTLGLEDISGLSMSPGLRPSTHRVAEQCWRATSVDTTDTFCTTDLAPSLKVALVHLWINLSTAFDKIQRSDGEVGETLEEPYQHSLRNFRRRQHSRKPSYHRRCKPGSTEESTTQSCQSLVA